MPVDEGPTSSLSDGGARASPEARTSRKPLGCLIEIAQTLVLTVVILWLVQSFVAQPFQVKQDSMRPTLEPDQNVLIDKITPRLSPLQRGDVVVFMPFVRDPSCDAAPLPYPSDVTPYIKRVIGEPGDVVDVRDGAVFVNGAVLAEPYTSGELTQPQAGTETWVVQQDRLFVLGDNRENSIDSRSDTIGQVCLRDVLGRAWLRYWPINSVGVLSRPAYQ